MKTLITIPQISNERLSEVLAGLDANNIVYSCKIDPSEFEFVHSLWVMDGVPTVVYSDEKQLCDLVFHIYQNENDKFLACSNGKHHEEFSTLRAAMCAVDTWIKLL